MSQSLPDSRVQVGVAEVADVAGVQCEAIAETGLDDAGRGEATLGADDDLMFEIFSERAAIRQYDGGQVPGAAERAALSEVAVQFGVTSAKLRQRWLSDPDAQAYLGFVADRGRMPLAEAASSLGWPLERAWAAEARLRACGLSWLGAALAEAD